MNRRRLAALVAAETARRCLNCRRDLATVPPPTLTTLDGGRFCDRACFDTFTAWNDYRAHWRQAQRADAEEDGTT